MHEHFTSQAFQPESLWMNNFDLAGLLTYSLLIAFPFNNDSGL
jgi:hypothetical protein